MKKALLVAILIFFACSAIASAYASIQVSINSDSEVGTRASVQSTTISDKDDEQQAKASIEIQEVGFKCVDDWPNDKIKIYAKVKATIEDVPENEVQQYKPWCSVSVDEIALDDMNMDKYYEGENISCTHGRHSHCSGYWEIKYKKSIRIPSEDIIHVRITCKNEKGIEETSKKEFNISECKKNDTTPPNTIVTPFHLEFWYSGTITVKLECQDIGGVGCESIFYLKAGASDSGNFQNLWNSQNNLNSLTLSDSKKTEISFEINEPTLIVFASKDVAGNFEKPKLVYVRVDNKAPETAYSGPEGNINGSAKIVLSCSDPAPYQIDLPLSSGCKNTKYSIDSGDWADYSGAIEISTAGCHNIRYYSVDHAGNEETFKEKNFCIEQVQSEKLTITSGPSVEIKSYDMAEITWGTNKEADSIVQYGTSQSFEHIATGSTGITHAVQLQNLKENTKYYYKVISSVQGEKVESSSDFTTPAKPIEEIKITNQKILASGNSVKISWETSCNASCDIYLWQIGEDAESIHVSDSAITHSTILKNLSEKTAYGFKISCSSGLLSASTEGSFTTLGKEESAGKETAIKIEQPFYPGEAFGEISYGASTTATAKPKIKGINVTPSTRAAYEGELFRFDVDIDFSRPSFEYIWDFGDGTIIKTAEATSYHGYMLEGTEQKDYIVKVLVRDSQTSITYGDAETKVNVRRAVLKIRVIEPEQGVVLPKDREAIIKIAFVDANNQILDQSSISQYKAYAGSERLYAKFSENLLVIRYDPKLIAKNYELIKIMASGNVQGRTVDIVNYVALHFSPIQLSISHDPFENKKYYLGSKISPPLYRMEIMLKPKALQTKMQYVVASLEREDYRERVNATLAEYASFLNIGHRVTLEDIEKGLYLKLEGKDIYGNILNERLAIATAKDNPDFDLVIHEPEKIAAIRGKTVEIKSSIKSRIGLQGKVSFDCGKDEKLASGNASYDDKEKLYTFSFTVPISYKADKIECAARAVSDYIGMHYEDYEEFSISVISDLVVEFIMPRPGINISSRPLDSIELDIKRVDGTRLNEPTLEGTISIDGNRFEIKIEKFWETYRAKLPRQIEFGEHRIRLEIQKPAYSTKELTMTLVMGFSNIEIASIIAAIAVSVYLAYRASKYLNERKNMRKQLELEAENLQALMNKLKVEYFKKHISQEEFEERYSEAKNRLKQIRRLLGQKK